MLNYVGFNQDSTCISCGTSDGFIIWNCRPIVKRVERINLGRIVIVEPLYRTNIIALVGDSEKWPNNQLQIWDDAQDKVHSYIKLPDAIIAVKLTRTIIVMATKNKVYIYACHDDIKKVVDNKLLGQMMTFENTPCTIALNDNIVIFPGFTQGFIHAANITSTIDASSFKPNRIISAHNNSIAAVALAPDGRSLASVSTRGTVIRVWSLETGAMLFEFRRGLIGAIVTGLAFSQDNRWLVACTGKGTTHIFDLRTPPKKDMNTTMEYINGLLPSWSFAQCRFPATEVDVRVAMDNEYNVYVVTKQAEFYWYRIDPIHGGETKIRLDAKLC